MERLEHLINTLAPALQQHIADGFVMVRQHPTADLYILNYAAKTQFERAWDEYTLACLCMNGLLNKQTINATPPHPDRHQR